MGTRTVKEDSLLKVKGYSSRAGGGFSNGKPSDCGKMLLLVYLPLSAWGRGLVPSDGIHLSGLSCLFAHRKGINEPFPIYQIYSVCSAKGILRDNLLMSRSCYILSWSEGVISAPEVSGYGCLCLFYQGPSWLPSNVLSNPSQNEGW